MQQNQISITRSLTIADAESSGLAEHSNAQRASSKQAMIDSSAERPAHRRVNPRIPYIYCPRWCLHREPELLLQALEHAMTVASTIINVVFDNENDAKHLKLKDIWNEQFATLSVQAFVSLYSKDSWQLLSCKDIDPINKSACVMLTFSSSDFTCYRIDCCRRGICSIAHLFLSFSTASITMPMLECPCGRQFDIQLEATLKKKLVERPKLTPLQPSRGLIDLPMPNQPASQRTPRSPSPHRAEANQLSSWKPTPIGGKPAPQPMTSSSSGQEDRQQKRLELKKLRCSLTNPNYWENWQDSTPGAECSNSRRPMPPVCDPPQYLLEDRSRSPRKS
jgi:hypothetical protein